MPTTRKGARQTGLRKKSRTLKGGLFGISFGSKPAPVNTSNNLANLTYQMSVLLKNNCLAKYCDNCKASLESAKRSLDKLKTVKNVPELKEVNLYDIEQKLREIEMFQASQNPENASKGCPVNPGTLNAAKRAKTLKNVMRSLGISANLSRINRSNVGPPP
jgi:hypothetical protein